MAALLHSFAMHTLEWLIRGYYQQAAALGTDTGADAALALYLTRSDPMTVLRDLLGPSSVTGRPRRQPGTAVLDALLDRSLHLVDGATVDADLTVARLEQCGSCVLITQ